MKKSDLASFDFYLVTDSGLSSHGTLHDVEQAVGAGCRIVQYREKNKPTRDMVSEAAKIAKICQGRAVFLVNDRIDVALAVDVDGVHIGQDDMPYSLVRKLLGPDKVIGLTTHNVDESLEAERIGADYIGLSPIFNTATKEDAGTGCGVDMVRAVREAVSLPIVAIGGLSMENTGDVIAAGADMAVAISAVVTADDVAGEVRAFMEMIRRARNEAPF